MLDQWVGKLMDWKINGSLVRESLDQLVEDEWINMLIKQCMHQRMNRSMGWAVDV